MKYVNILLIGLVLLFPGCTFLDVVPEGNIESIESNFEKRDQTENWFKYCHFWVSPFTTSVISNPAYMGTDEVVAGTYLRESGFNWSGLYIADGLQRTFDPYCNMWRRKVSEKDAFFFCYAARLLSIFIFKTSLVFSIISFGKVILQK